MVTVGLGVGIGVWASTSGSSGSSGASSGSSTGASASGETRSTPGTSPSTRPPSSYPLSTAPRTVPAVTSHTPARGPGWRPAAGYRVVVDDSRLADEGRLIAGELGIAYGGEAADARAGDVRLELGEDGPAESYSMTVSGGRVIVSGASEAGVFYGTRTLKQEVRGSGGAPEGVVRDAPAKPVRGFMLDIARKNFSAAWIEDRVRELGDLKFNQLGLHFSDDQGFRIASDTHPEVVSKVHLTKAEVRSIVSLAASRHIEIVPEIDSPGHLGAVLAAHPELRLRNVNGVPTKGAIDISKAASARIVDELLGEYAELFPGSDWHLGGDEYQALTVPNPGALYPQLATAARDEYGAGAGVADLATGWLNDRAKAVAGRTVRAWNDGFYQGTSVQADQGIQVAYWTGKEIGARKPVEYLAAGRQVVNYNDEFLYYVLGEPNTFVYPTGQRIYERWNPRVLRGTTEVPATYDSQILGGVFAVWCDLSNSQTQAQVAAGIRMPLRATAQKLWDARQPKLSWARFRELAGRVS
ncbi:family 20 glycosylhydrolase [Streptomyces roseirectus]|uniref:Family 20 glycosylhydrolase n=1 Tax=Streptomyces roseirectus TaxID=2768066 RepID=A0A7H0ISK6_9ACTN|nr:glycoside hydrolase family 20 protein [Streptomyces roseirectus]QNP75772.1 family 20 glycosylhydrolase [Streptomyces roseirectus]